MNGMIERKEKKWSEIHFCFTVTIETVFISCKQISSVFDLKTMTRILNSTYNIIKLWERGCYTIERTQSKQRRMGMKDIMFIEDLLNTSCQFIFIPHAFLSDLFWISHLSVENSKQYNENNENFQDPDLKVHIPIGIYKRSSHLERVGLRKHVW